MKTVVRLANKNDMRKVLDIRRIVFIEGQNVPAGRERDRLKATYFVAEIDGKTVGTGRIRSVGKKAKLERMAVLEEYRGKGIGKALLDFMVDFCKKKGYEEVVVSSQCHAKGFYKSAGFTEKSGVFKDAGIDHVEMSLK